MRQARCDQIAQGLFYRGHNPKGSSKRILTGKTLWDNMVFVADNIESARWYGSTINAYRLKKGTRLLCEGTKVFQKIAGQWPNTYRPETMLDFAERSAKAAKTAGYDAVWYKRQTDMGTAIIREVLEPVLSIGRQRQVES